MRTVLAPLSLEGTGTPLVESVASYSLRLALVHQVRHNHLAQVLCNDSSFLKIGGGPVLRWRALYPAMLCSYSPQTRMLVARLEKLTGQSNLSLGTLLRFEENLCRNQTGALVEIRRWCPECYSERPNHGAEPLVWQIPLISRCPSHDAPLQSKCAHCGAKQLVWRIDSERTQCHRCKRTLADSAESKDKTTWDEWCQREMLRLLEHIGSPDSPSFCEDAAKTFVSSLPRPLPASRYGQCRACITTFRRQIGKCPSARPRLNTIFELAAAWGTTPLDILLRPKEAASANLFDSDAPLPARAKKRPYQAQNHRACERHLHALMRLPKMVLLPPGIHVLRQFKVSVTFSTRRKALWSKYVQERRSRSQFAREKQVVTATLYVEAMMAKLKASQQHLHRRRAIAETAKAVKVSVTVARSALRVTLLRMRISRDDGTSSAVGR